MLYIQTFWAARMLRFMTLGGSTEMFWNCSPHKNGKMMIKFDELKILRLKAPPR